MMRTIRYIVLGAVMWLIGASASASTLAQVLSSVESNNTELKALRNETQSRKLANHTGISLADPEVGYDYMWGNPSAIGRRIGISFSQRLDVATLSGQKSRMADSEDRLVDIEYDAMRMDILLEAQLRYLDAIYWNARVKELEVRAERANKVAEAGDALLKSGEGNILQKNSAEVNRTTVEAELSVARVELAAVLSELARLNGGNSIEVNVADFAPVVLPSDFDKWFSSVENHWPSMEYAAAVVEQSQRRIKLNKTEGLPTISAGFMRERVEGQSYTGLKLGMSLPLWQNRNRVKQAKAAAITAQSRQTQSRQQLYDNLRTLYGRAVGLKAVAESYAASLQTHSNVELLGKALNAGELSIVDYIVQTEYYYNAYDRMVEALRDYHKAHAELTAVENL